jgi:hypothetical protein
MTNNKKIIYPVWVNGKRFNGAAEAALSAGLLLGEAVDAGWLSEQMREYGSVAVRGVLISVLGPGRRGGAEPATVRTAPRTKECRGKLLNYPAGGDLLGRGLCRPAR